MTASKSQEPIGVFGRQSIFIGKQILDTTEEDSAYQEEWLKIAHVMNNAEHPLRMQSYLLPHSLEELRLKQSGFYGLAEGTSVFARGWTDYAHSLLSGWYGHESHFSSVEPGVSGHIHLLFQEKLKQRAIITTSLHSIVKLSSDLPVVQHTDKGCRLHGRQTFNADALFADELLVFIHEDGEIEPSTLALIPTRTTGLQIRAYEATKEAIASEVHVAYEDVEIPWERILINDDVQGIKQLLEHPFVKSIADYQWVSRQLDALELTVGTACALAEQTGLSGELHIQGDLGELIQHVETLKALIHAAEIGSEASTYGIVLPAAVPLEAARKAGGLFYDKSIQVLQRIGASTILGDPLNAESTREGSQPTLLQLAWSLSSSGEAAKRRLHELYAFGDPITQSADQFRHYPSHLLRDRYRQFWQTVAYRQKMTTEEVRQ